MSGKSVRGAWAVRRDGICLRAHARACVCVCADAMAEAAMLDEAMAGEAMAGEATEVV